MSISTSKACWTPAFHKVFVDLCVEEILKLSEPKDHITRQGWKNILGSFNVKTGVRYDQKQIKNHYDLTRKLWKIWDKLVSDNSMKWDAETKIFAASEEDWRNYIEANPEAAQFRYKEIQFREKLGILFDEAARTREIKSLASRKCHNEASTAYDLPVRGQGEKLRNVCSNYEFNSGVVDNDIPTSKATWTHAHHKIFVDLCFDETLKGNKPGTHFTKEGWRNIVACFHAKTGLRYDKKQIKNHYDSIRKQWNVWVNLTADGIMKWDQENNEFGASEKEWSDYIEAVPEASQFRFKGIQFPEKLDFIFDGGMQTGERKSSARLKRKKDASAASHLHGKEQDKRQKYVVRDCDSSAILVNAVPITAIASEHSMSSSSCRKIKATWAPGVHETFVDLCLQETLKGNKPGTHFTKEGWKNIMESFYLKTGLNYDRLQLKNHWDSTKEQWKIWCKLIGTDYMKWNPSYQKFDASEEDWTGYLQANPEAGQFRLKELQYADILEAVFNGMTVTGESSEPAVQQKKSDDSVVTFPLHPEKPDANNLDKTKDCLCDVVGPKCGVRTQNNAAETSSSEGKRNYSIGECIECLDSMEEIEQGSELYMFALDVFLKQEYREIFLQLKKPNLRISWLERIQSSGPPSLQ